jgi:hypothetical protein
MQNQTTVADRPNDQPQWTEVVARAQTDPTFRQQLLAYPERTLQEFGFSAPEGVRIVIHEFDPNEQHLFLPPHDVMLGVLPVTSYGTPKNKEE